MGGFVFSDNDSAPINLLKIGKSNCRNLKDVIQSFYLAYSSRCLSPFNIIRLKIRPNKSFEYEFDWDESLVE